ncbi:MAG: hypothetical protein KC503_24190 [Myxococcales bacterium]|nr:hypothetical protein [Myxococcales bacterium]
MGRAAAVLALLAFAACTFDTAGVGSVDGGLSDGALSDGALSDVALADGPRPDSLQPDAARDATLDMPLPDSTVDAPKPDSTIDLPAPDSTVDLPPPDTSVDSPPPATCAQLFGSVNGYVLCNETAISCRFHFTSVGSNKSCNLICGTKTCLLMRDNASGSNCALETPNTCGNGPCTCGSTLGDGICTCSK